jgi:hypothetical protein
VELIKKFIPTFYGNFVAFLNAVNVIIMPSRLRVGIPEWIKWPDTNRTTAIRFRAVVDISIIAVTWRRALGPTQSPFECVPGLNLPVLKAEHSPSPSTEIQHVWSFASTLHSVWLLRDGTFISELLPWHPYSFSSNSIFPYFFYNFLSHDYVFCICRVLKGTQSL